MFTVKIKTGNAAFRDQEHELWNGEHPLDCHSHEIRRLLQVVQERLYAGYAEGKLIDINGNAVGEWKLTD